MISGLAPQYEIYSYAYVNNNNNNNNNNNIILLR